MLIECGTSKQDRTAKKTKKNTNTDHVMAIIESVIIEKCLMERNCFQKDKDKSQSKQY